MAREITCGNAADILAVEEDAARRGTSSRRMIIVDVVDLPQPDSPTRPTLSPRRTSKD